MAISARLATEDRNAHLLSLSAPNPSSSPPSLSPPPLSRPTPSPTLCNVLAR